jgi:branched-chain amino acid transport system permease protein
MGLLGFFIYGLVNSFVLALMAIGFSLAYGVSRVPNFAHGSLYVLTGFSTWIFLNRVGLNLPLSIILSLLISGTIGGLAYQLILKRVRGVPASEIIASFSIGLAIMELLRWGGLRTLTFTLPSFIEGTVDLFGVPVDAQRLIIIGATGLAVLALWLLTHYTTMGLALRAIAQDERAALMLGMDSDLAATVALALGSAFAGLAAILILPLGNITVEAGYEVLTFAIAIAVCGGLGSWIGSVLAAFVLGYAQTAMVHFIAPQFQMVVAMLAIIIMLIAKPSGLLGKQKELEDRV